MSASRLHDPKVADSRDIHIFLVSLLIIFTKHFNLLMLVHSATDHSPKSNESAIKLVVEHFHDVNAERAFRVAREVIVVAIASRKFSRCTNRCIWQLDKSVSETRKISKHFPQHKLDEWLDI